TGWPATTPRRSSPVRSGPVRTAPSASSPAGRPRGRPRPSPPVAARDLRARSVSGPGPDRVQPVEELFGVGDDHGTDPAVVGRDPDTVPAAHEQSQLPGGAEPQADPAEVAERAHGHGLRRDDAFDRDA